MVFYNISSTDHGLFTHELEICSFDTLGQDLCRIDYSLPVPHVARVETGTFSVQIAAIVLKKLMVFLPLPAQDLFSIVFEMKTLPFQSRGSIWTREWDEVLRKDWRPQRVTSNAMENLWMRRCFPGNKKPKTMIFLKRVHSIKTLPTTTKRYLVRACNTLLLRGKELASNSYKPS